MGTSTYSGTAESGQQVVAPEGLPHVHLSPRDNRWGNAIDWSDFDERRVHGWLSPLPEVGDVFDCEMQSGNIARFRFTEVHPTYNPRDMFFGAVEFVVLFRPEEQAQ